MIYRLLVIALAISGLGMAGFGEGLKNPGFEETARDGLPINWTLLSNLDPEQYGGENGVWYRFNDFKPTAAYAGRSGSARCLGFPAQGIWHCPVKMHQRGGGDESKPGSSRGKAAAFQRVEVSPGDYTFTCWLRTRDGALWSAAFSLGIQKGAAQYAHDDSTGILWTEHNLGTKSDWVGKPEKTGEWRQYETPVLSMKEVGEVTVWIRFNYVNDNDMDARWQADDAELVRVVKKQPDPTPAPLEDNYDDWYDATSPAVTNPGFDDGPAADNKGPFAWKSQGKVELTKGYSGTAVSLSDGAVIEQDLRRPGSSRRRKWRAELWARSSGNSSSDAMFQFIAQKVDNATSVQIYEYAIPAAEEWSYVTIPGFAVEGQEDYNIQVRILGPKKGSLFVDSLSVEKDGRD